MIAVNHLLHGTPKRPAVSMHKIGADFESYLHVCIAGILVSYLTRQHIQLFLSPSLLPLRTRSLPSSLLELDIYPFTFRPCPAAAAAPEPAQ